MTDTWQQAAVKEYAGKMKNVFNFWKKDKGVETNMPIIKQAPKPQQEQTLSYEEAMQQFNQAQDNLRIMQQQQQQSQAMPPPPKVQQQVQEPPKIKVTYVNPQTAPQQTAQPLPQFTEQETAEAEAETAEPQQEQQQVTIEQIILDTHKQVREIRADVDAIIRLMIRR
jgi:DNA primase